jgi:PadR family transcriptional regulator PadR
MVAMAKGNYLGEFEYIVMLSLLRLGNDAYGMTIRQDIEESTRRPVAVGAVYAALDRLEQKGYIKSSEGETTRGRGGRSKTYYKVEGAGLEAVRQTRSVFRRMEKGVEAKLGPAFRFKAA